MTQLTSAEKFWGTDSFKAYAFPLNPDGSIKAVDLTPYEGLHIDGTRDFNLNPAAGTVVVNVGNGRLRDTIYRAPREASTAELLVGFTAPDVKAALSDVNAVNVGEIISIARLTNKQGSEPDITLLVTQRGHNDSGLTRFKTYVIAKSRVIPRDSPMTEAASVETYQVTMSNSKKKVTGVSYTINTDKATEATYEEWISENPVKLVGWVADGIEDTFPLPAGLPALAEAKLSVYNFTTGAEIVAGVDKSALTEIVFDYPPTEDDVLIAVYEFDESLL